MQEKQQNMSEHISISTVLSEKKKMPSSCVNIYTSWKKKICFLIFNDGKSLMQI